MVEGDSKLSSGNSKQEPSKDGVKFADTDTAIKPVAHNKTRDLALRALNSGISNAILDLRVSVNEDQESVLSKNGYTQLLSGDINPRSKSNTAGPVSTFGKKCSLWTWSRFQGTCAGRLKPIIDIQLTTSPTSTDFVLSGYTCDPVPISGQWLWIRRAVNEEEEKDAIIKLQVTTGKMKDTSDPIWSSPGVGWIRVEGNFSKSLFGGLDSILWVLPDRNRSMEYHMSAPTRSAVALSEEARHSKLLAAVRVALRHYVMIHDMKRTAYVLSDLSGTPNTTVNNKNHSVTTKSEHIADFVGLFHEYESKGKISMSIFTKLLNDVGLRLEKKDAALIFKFFDEHTTGSITVDEFAKMLALTDYELDLAVDRLKVKLLQACAPAHDPTTNPKSINKQVQIVSKPCAGVIGAGSINIQPSLGKYRIRENAILAQVFQLLNTNNDGILSLDELMQLAFRLEIYLSEEEFRKMAKMFDVQGNNRVEETSFISFMRQDSRAVVNKAFRVREAAALLRRWLVRGTTEKATTSVGIAASATQWKNFKKKHEKLTKEKFPGFLSPRLLMLTLNELGLRLSTTEARELAMLVAPEKNGRVHQADLHAFMGRECRTFGELMALLDRDLLSDFIDLYHDHFRAWQADLQEDPEKADAFRKELAAIRRKIDNVYTLIEADAREGEMKVAGADEDDDEDESPKRSTYHSTSHKPYVDARGTNKSNELVPITQLKAGMDYMYKKLKIPDNQIPNLEEWACLSILVQADVVDGEIFGVRVKNFLEGICIYSVAMEDEARLKAGDKASLEVVCRDLKRQICLEALVAGSKGVPNYRTVFDMFDDNMNGLISLEEFRNELQRLQLVGNLPDSALPNLIALFNKSKSENIRYEDFVTFAEEGKRGIKLSKRGDGATGSSYDDGGYDDGGYDDAAADDVDWEDDDWESMTTNIPPTAITRNNDCDWLLWFLYREACKVEPTDPESVITELEAQCSETEMTQAQPSISIKELWNILFEMGLQGGMTKAQFIKGVQLISEDGNGSDDDRVDHEALCRYTIRMGRAFNALLQERAKEDEKKFAPLIVEIKQYFKDLCQEKPADPADRSGLTRFEKIFRRLDADGDGTLTAKEFKIGLRKLKYPDEKKWSIRMIRRLFIECDKNRDGLLSIQEFTNYVNEKDSQQRIEMAAQERKKDGKVGNNRTDRRGLDLSDDEDDEIFKKHRVLTDHQLLRKVNDVLMDIVPMEPYVTAEKHTDLVRGSVRRFFQRADPEFKGHVSEERFRAFLRRSSLQDRLTASELRRLTEKLKKRASGGSRGEAVIDYEKLIQQLHMVTDSAPRSQAEAIFVRFQDAAATSAAAGRSFLSLCSLVDLRFTGCISKEELLHTSKMMDCNLTMQDLEVMLQLLPESAVVEGREGKGLSVDYRMLQDMLQSFTPRGPPGAFTGNMNATLDPRSFTNNSRTGALPSYANPGSTLLGDTFNQNYDTINTPLGMKINTTLPRGGSGRFGSTGLSGGYNEMGADANARAIQGVVERLRSAIDHKSRLLGAPFSLKKQFEVYDGANEGVVSTRTLQGTLDDIGVSLTPADLHAIQLNFGRPEDDRIYYQQFCRVVEGGTTTFVGNETSRRFPVKTFESGNFGGSMRGSGVGGPSYLNTRVLMRLQELRRDGRDPRDIFETVDLDRLGMVSRQDFRNVISKLQLLQSEDMLKSAMEDFSSLSDSYFIVYADFCTAIEKALNTMDDRAESRSRPYSATTGGMAVAGSGHDGFSRTYGGRTSRNWDDGELEADREIYRYRQSRYGTGDYPIDLDEGTAMGYRNTYGGMSPPKLSSSINYGGLPTGRYSNAPTSRSGFGNTGDLSPVRNRRSIPVPHLSPSKVGSKMWGSGTPLAKKGHMDQRMVQEGKWCCGVCLYVENPNSATHCVVCDSPNYHETTGFQLTEQCRNCTFLNGQFADECEMCGEPLNYKRGLASAQSSANKFGSASINRRLL